MVGTFSSGVLNAFVLDSSAPATGIIDTPITGPSGGTAWWETPTTLRSRYSGRHQTSYLEAAPKMIADTKMSRPTRNVLVKPHELPRPTQTPRKKSRYYAGMNSPPPSRKYEPARPRGLPGLAYIGPDKHEDAKRPYTNGLTREEALNKWQKLREEHAERPKPRHSTASQMLRKSAFAVQQQISLSRLIAEMKLRRSSRRSRRECASS
ncbi:hypothetical protein BU16DRAFT_313319 [Lophium mytilinum]|uniref:Uncharacterized protein n=1 Tax=Lophium mytilinum TaxID=390894 RepID=A0A6A6QZH0_9PEZI|nr:hypothetical protein BU16DRAFT_313319 [Lophium mytilinum]